MDAKYYVDKLGLLPHPEGGYYKETYRAEGMFGDRNFATGIYFLLTENNFSAFHRIKSDEVWHFYSGATVTITEITSEGKLIETLLGSNLSAGEVFQYTVPAGHWFGSYLSSNQGFALVGCTVSPGFDFRDFEMGDRLQLCNRYPALEGVITRLTRV